MNDFATSNKLLFLILNSFKGKTSSL